VVTFPALAHLLFLEKLPFTAKLPSLATWLGIPIFGSNFWDPHCKRNFDSVFDSKVSGHFFFEIPISGESENWNSDLQYLEFW
jgi:hypothetical protein